MAGEYLTILADPPWEMSPMGQYKGRHKRALQLPYPTMTVKQIKDIPVNNLAAVGCHLWLWATNQTLFAAYGVMKAWGFKYLNTIIWKKPSGFGNYFVNVTQPLLFGYKQRCYFNKLRYMPNFFEWPDPHYHSRKPAESYQLIESVSESPRLEIFARPITPLFPKVPEWDVWGNEVDPDVEIKVS